MTTLSLDQLATYKLVISRGSFTAAATVLGLSQPAVSLQIRQLEATLQARLIERTGRGIRPTPAGLTLLEHCAEIDRAVNTAVQAVARHQQHISGSVVLGTGATLCIHLLPPVLLALRQLWPKLTVDVRTGNTQDIVRAIEENRIDIGLVTLPAAGKNIEITPAMKEEFVVIGATGLEGVDAPFSPARCAAMPLIVFESGSGVRQQIDNWFLSAGVEAKSVMELGSVEAIKRMVRAGLGVSIVPRMAVAQPLEREGLEIFPLEPPLHRTLGWVMRQDRVVHRGIQEVVHHITEAIRKLTDEKQALSCGKA
ncbi:LysR family transcriptional regulator [Yokenella regensburgei]|uniref:LysR family transcriptional regulator n=1 Tax=Yokenella regensburgei TaxID=158877 RepID=UPI003F18970C